MILKQLVYVYSWVPRRGEENIRDDRKRRWERSLRVWGDMKNMLQFTAD